MVVCGDVWWFWVFSGGLWWFAVICGGFSFSHTAKNDSCVSPKMGCLEYRVIPRQINQGPT